MLEVWITGGMLEVIEDVYIDIICGDGSVKEKYKEVKMETYHGHRGVAHHPVPKRHKKDSASSRAISAPPREVKLVGGAQPKSPS